MNKAVKAILGFVLIGLVAGLGFYLFSGKKQPTTSLSSTTGVTNTGAESADIHAGDEFLGLLLSISNIQLDASLFSNPSFKSLRDFSSQLPSGTPSGRPNPFAPLGQDSTPSSDTYAVVTGQTFQITPTSATLVGVLPPGLIPNERWFMWGTAQGALTNETPHVQQNLSNNTFVFTVSNLTPNTTYYVQAVGKVGQVQFSGSVGTFKTLASLPGN